MHIRSYLPTDRDQVIELWHSCNLLVPWNDPVLDIDAKLADSPELFLVAVDNDGIIGSAMGGYDGHRGWIYYLAVHPDRQNSGLGSRLVGEVEQLLTAQGCPKINIMVRRTNHGVISFYEKLGYEESEVLTYGKKLPSGN